MGDYAVWRQEAESKEGLHVEGGDEVVVSCHGAVRVDKVKFLNAVSNGIGVESIPFELFRKVEEFKPFVLANGGNAGAGGECG